MSFEINNEQLFQATKMLPGVTSTSLIKFASMCENWELFCKTIERYKKSPANAQWKDIVKIIHEENNNI